MWRIMLRMALLVLMVIRRAVCTANKEAFVVPSPSYDCSYPLHTIQFSLTFLLLSHAYESFEKKTGGIVTATRTAYAGSLSKENRSRAPSDQLT